jgi:hypothetical protein
MGMTAMAFGQSDEDQGSANPLQTTANITGSGTTNFIPRFTGNTTIGNSVMFQFNGNIGINNNTPGARLDVRGRANIRDTITVFPLNGHNALIVNGSTFALDSLGKLHFAPGQTFPGVVTNVIAGTGLSGGGTGTPTLSLNTSFTDGRYARLGAINNFTVDQQFTDIFASGFIDSVQLFTGDISATDIGLNTGDARAITANNNGGTQAVQMQNFTTGFGFIEAQFNASSVATFYTDNAGNTTAIGTKSAAVPLKSGQMVKVFSMESPEVWFEDFGGGQIVGGVGTVRLDPSFLQTVNLKGGYHIFLTPLGDCKGLYIANKTGKDFEVRELGGGQATVDFEYRIVAHRAGYDKTRLPVATLPQVGNLQRPERPTRPH